MRRPLLAALCALAFAPPAAALPTADEVKANVRRAVGFDALRKLDHGLDLDGKADYSGLSGTFRMRLHPDGRYARVITAAGCTHAVGFDGKTRWGQNFNDPPLDLHFAEADRDLFLFGVLCHRWLAADGGFVTTVDEKVSRAYRLELVLTHPDAGVAARLVVDPTTWHPELLTIPGKYRPRLLDFSDYRAVSGVTVPTRIGQNRFEGGQWMAAERAGPAGGGPAPFARPTGRAEARFDPVVPARLEARKASGRMMLVRGAVDGKAGAWFLLDTGNGAQTILSAGWADRLGLPASGDIRLAGTGGQIRGRLRTADRFTIGPATIPRPVFMDSPDGLAATVSQSAGVEVGGFLGQDFLFRVVVEIDPGAGTVAVHDPTGYRLPAGGAWEPVRFNGRTPCVRAAFDGKHAGWYEFDSGFEAPLIFHRSAVDRGKMLDGRETTTHTLVGLGGEELVQEGAGGEFRVFGRASRVTRVLYATDPAGGHSDPYTLGTFGSSALGRGTVVLDYPNSRIGFVPSE